MKIQKEFSRNAKAYNRVNIIQQKVLQSLVAKIDDAPKSVLDIGCGNGGIYHAIDWELEHFTGVDFAEGMLALHPKAAHISLIESDFNDPVLFKRLAQTHYDRIISASALQWANDLDSVLANIAALHAPVSLAIFTANTFRTLYQTANLPPLLRSKEETVSLLKKHFCGEIEVLEYTLTFSSVREMFRYMKQSGVGAGRNVLGYKAMKQLMQTYPLDYLEYEIVLCHEKQPR
ncbi:putative methyl transferase [hydrothermal vent metagenome]|uniref:Putative methyl transferase n=1 Tax=hydrothermal vent metagenome TaxID=652676 RepID=A0A1W1E989_9ZZZZ